MRGQNQPAEGLGGRREGRILANGSCKNSCVIFICIVFVTHFQAHMVGRWVQNASWYPWQVLRRDIQITVAWCDKQTQPSF